MTSRHSYGGGRSWRDESTSHRSAARYRYFFQTETRSTSTGETLVAPAVPLAVQTEIHTVRAKTEGAVLVPFSNDLLIFPSLLPDGVSPAAGALLVVTVTGARHPVSGFVGDGVPAPHALLDMNNFFGATTNATLDLMGNEVLTIRDSVVSVTMPWASSGTRTTRSARQ